MSPRPKKKKLLKPLFKFETLLDRLPELKVCENGYKSAIDNLYLSTERHFQWLNEIVDIVKGELTRESKNNVLFEFASPVLPKTPSQKRQLKTDLRVKPPTLNISVPPENPIHLTRSTSRRLLFEKSTDQTNPEPVPASIEGSSKNEKQNTNIGKSPRHCGVRRKSSTVHKSTSQKTRKKKLSCAASVTVAVLQEEAKSEQKKTTRTNARFNTPKMVTRTGRKQPVTDGKTQIKSAVNSPRRFPYTPVPVKKAGKIDISLFATIRNTPEKVRKEREKLRRKQSELQKVDHQKALENKRDIIRQRIEETKRKREEREKRVQANLQENKKIIDTKRQVLEEKCTATDRLRRQEEQKVIKQRTPGKTPRKKKSPIKIHQSGFDSSKKSSPSKKPLNEDRTRSVKKRSISPKDNITKEESDQHLTPSLKPTKRRSPTDEMKLIKPECIIVAPQKTELMNFTATEAKKPKLSVEADSMASKTVTSEKSFRSPNPVSRNHGTYQSSNSERRTFLKPKKSGDSNYDINDLGSGDDTDDEDDPRKPIPLWAKGPYLKAALIQQYYNPPNLEVLFGRIEYPKLEMMFTKVRKRFTKRTSSAIWDSPLWPNRSKTRYSD